MFGVAVVNVYSTHNYKYFLPALKIYLDLFKVFAKKSKSF